MTAPHLRVVRPPSQLAQKLNAYGRGYERGFAEGVACVPRARPPKSLASRFWGSLRSLLRAFGMRPQWLWRWVWEREFQALLGDQERARVAGKGGRS